MIFWQNASKISMSLSEKHVLAPTLWFPPIPTLTGSMFGNPTVSLPTFDLYMNGWWFREGRYDIPYYGSYGNWGHHRVGFGGWIGYGTFTRTRGCSDIRELLGGENTRFPISSRRSRLGIWYSFSRIANFWGKRNTVKWPGKREIHDSWYIFPRFFV